MVGVRNIVLLAGASLMLGQCCAAPWSTKIFGLRRIPKKTNPSALQSSTPPAPSTRSTVIPESIESVDSVESVAIKSVRGGGNVLESIDDFLSQENLSSLFASITMAEGIFLTFAPDVAFRLDGGSIERDSLGGFVAQVLGSMNIGTAMTVILLTKSQTPLSKAVGLGILPRVFVGIASWLSGKLSRVGFQFGKALIIGNIAIGGAILTSLILEKGKTDAMLKAIAGVEAVTGLLLAHFPEKCAKTADIDLSTEENKQAKALFRLMGQSYLSHGVYVGLLVAGCVPSKALGVATSTVVLGQVMTVSNKGHEDLGLSQDRFIGYAIVLAGIAGKLLADDIDIDE